MIDDFDDFSQAAQIASEEVPFGGGAIWNSDRRFGPSGRYEATIPSGLHISVGKARICTHSEKYGGFRSEGSTLSFVRIDDEEGVFDTQLEAGSVRSFGYYLPAQAFENATSVLQSINDAALNRPLMLLNGEAALAAERLLSPLGEEFQGDIRTMLLQARAMELIALVGSAVERGVEPYIWNASSNSAATVREYIEAHLGARLELSVLAEHCQVSQRTMTHAFRAAYSESIMEYATRRRMERGAQMLSEGASTAVTAYTVGYTPNAFSTAFKKHFGMSPSQSARGSIAGSR